ncbi:MAG: cobyric acid synthase [Spirochaetota bacterium]|nr:cobyric acid synthase [Spirochaetota bacterium]
MRAKAIQVCGTGSGVGKSVLVAGLCRIFLQEGFSVAPFKAQNMALNSAVTSEGLEIGRAQAMQAGACRIEPTVDMNPILLKPTSDIGSQVVVLGKPHKNMKAVEYYEYKAKALEIVKGSLDRLMSQYDIVVIEGAGSPAEFNLKERDIVNLKVASMINAPVILVGDIDRGGVFAWLVGTLELLEESERHMIKAFIINKFRGDKALLYDGLSILEERTGKSVMGVVPYFRDIHIPEEDSLFFEEREALQRREQNHDIDNDKVTIAVVRLPHISNFTDFDTLDAEEGIRLEYTMDCDRINRADVIIIPGSKNTLADMQYIADNGIAEAIRRRAEDGAYIIGICGGYQMLGRGLSDMSGVESTNKKIDGLGLLDIETDIMVDKKTFQIQGKDIRTGMAIKGYEIHHGETRRSSKAKPAFLIEKRGIENVHIEDGAMSADGKIFGTYIHGIFDNFAFRRWLINNIRGEKGLAKLTGGEGFNQDNEYDALADLLRSNLNLDLLYDILDLTDKS